MQFPRFKQHQEISETSIQAKASIQQSFHNIQNHCSNFLQHFSNSLQQFSQQQQRRKPNFHLFNPKAHIDYALENLGNQVNQALQAATSGLGFGSNSKNNPVWSSISVENKTQREPIHRFDLAMSNEAIEERLAGVPVYALSNSAEEFVLVSGVSTGKSLGLFCFKKEDAEALLDQMKSMDPGMRRGSKVVSVALNKVFQLKLDGVAFRFIPDSSQVKNALKEKQRAGSADEFFSGVPVFQSRSLILRSQNKRYRPVFFRKEDLDKSLQSASRQQNLLNPALKQGDIQVAVLEEIIKGMKESSSKWDDVVFIPPGFDVSTHLPQQEKLTASG